MDFTSHLTDGALAEQLTKIANDVRAFNPDERAAFLTEAAARLERDRSPLSIGTAGELGTILGWAQRNARLRWLSESGDILEGTARSVGDIDGNFARLDDDVRDCFFRVTTTNGFERFMPMSLVLELVETGSIAED